MAATSSGVRTTSLRRPSTCGALCPAIATSGDPVQRRVSSSCRRRIRLPCRPTPALREQAVERLEAGWSPQQIAGRLRHEQADGGASVCHETIYRHVYGPEGREGGL